jgi:hypothetical protein
MAATHFRPRPSNEPFGPSTAESERAGPLPRRNLNVRINGRDCSIPINDGFVEHRSLCGAAELLHTTGGLEAKLLPATWSTIRIGLIAAADAIRVQRRISALAGDLLQMGMDASADGVPPGCIPGFLLHDRGSARLDAELYIERVGGTRQLDLERLCLEAAARAVALPLARLAECESDPRIQALRTRVEQVRVTCRVDISDLAARASAAAPAPGAALPFGPARIHDLVRSFGANSHQPRLTAEHNDHVIGASSAAAFELGLDHRRFELDARAHATRWGSCEPLATWRWRERELLGQLQIPLEVHRWTAPAPPNASDTPSNRQDSSDLLLQVASVGLIASLSFISRGLLGQSHDRRRRGLLPPPLPESMRGREGKPLPAEKVFSESGVHPIVPSSSDPSWSHTG